MDPARRPLVSVRPRLSSGPLADWATGLYFWASASLVLHRPSQRTDGRTEWSLFGVCVPRRLRPSRIEDGVPRIACPSDLVAGEAEGVAVAS